MWKHWSWRKVIIQVLLVVGTEIRPNSIYMQNVHQKVDFNILSFACSQLFDVLNSVCHLTNLEEQLSIQTIILMNAFFLKMSSYLLVLGI